MDSGTAYLQGQIVKSKSDFEYISIGIGNFGVLSNLNFFEEIAKEHQIVGTRNYVPEFNIIEKPSSFFDEVNGAYIPRSINVDCDSVSINEFSSSVIGSGISSDLLFEIKNSSKNLFELQDSQIFDPLKDSIRKTVEKCDSFGGFQLFSDISCGFSAGALRAILDLICCEFFSYSRTEHILLGNESDSAVINTAASLDYLCESSNFTNLIYKQNLVKNLGNFGYDNIYRLVGKMSADLTSAQRSNGRRDTNIGNLNVNMTNIYRRHFYTTTLGTYFEQLFNDDLSLGKINRTSGRYHSSATIFRGNYSTYDAERFLANKYSELLNSDKDTYFSYSPFSAFFVNLEGLNGKSWINLTNHSSIYQEFGVIAQLAENSINTDNNYSNQKSQVNEALDKIKNFLIDI